MGLMWQPEDLIVNCVHARGAGENYHLPPLLYIDDPRGQGGLSLPHDEHFPSLELLCCLAESSPQQFWCPPVGSFHRAKRRTEIHRTRSGLRYFRLTVPSVAFAIGKLKTKRRLRPAPKPRKSPHSHELRLGFGSGVNFGSGFAVIFVSAALTSVRLRPGSAIIGFGSSVRWLRPASAPA